MLFIRHGEKEYTNGKSFTYSLDPDITPNGKLEAYSKFSWLLSHYGVPDKIIVSPYLRTRTTGNIARQVIKDLTGKEVEVMYDNYLSEYLRSDKYHHINMQHALRPETLQLNPMLPETQREYRNRMTELANTYVFSHYFKNTYVFSHYFKNTSNNVWVITHSNNIYTIASILGYHIKHPKELGGIAINNNGIQQF